MTKSDIPSDILDILRYSDPKTKIIQDIGIVFYKIFSETSSDQDLKLILKILNNEQNSNLGINPHIKESIKNVMFTFMLLYSEEITKIRKEQEDNRELIITVLNETKERKNLEQAEFTKNLIEYYKFIKNINFWWLILFSKKSEEATELRKRVFGGMRGRLFGTPTKSEVYYEFLLSKNIIQEKIFSFKVKKKMTDQDLIDLCNEDHMQTCAYIDKLIRYAKVHMF